MGNYVIYRQDDGVCLSHAGMKTMPKTERPGHKWIARLLSKSGLRYIYSPEQLRSYYNAQRDLMKKGTKVITTQGQENTAKWKVEKKPTAENKNNYERAKAANNYAQRDYYDARKAADKTIVGKLSSALKPKPSENSQKSDQNGRSRGQSNLYKTDKYGNTYRPGVISERPKGGIQSAEQGKEQSDKNDWKDNRPEGRKRNVTGKADPIQKGEGITEAKRNVLSGRARDSYRNYANAVANYGKDSKEAARAESELNSYQDKSVDLADAYYAAKQRSVYAYDEWHNLLNSKDKLENRKNGMGQSEYERQLAELDKNIEEQRKKYVEANNEVEELDNVLTALRRIRNK